MKNSHHIPLSDATLRYLPVILTPAKRLKKGKGVLAYIPTLPADPDDQGQDPIVFEED